MDLGKELSIRFAREKLPHTYDAVRQFFRRAGGYSKFKNLLAKHNQLDAWHRYEEASIKRALFEWCEQNGLGIK